MQVPPALLLLCLSGHLCLKGPGSVTGTTGGSVNVQCQYEEVYKGYNKYWCRGKYDTACNKIVETEGEAKEKRNGRVTIRDHAENLTLTVTMENLNADDAGSYWCRIQTVWILDVLSYDPSVNVNVSVWPVRTTCSTTLPTILMETTRQNLSIKGMLNPHSKSLLSSVPLMLLVFLKVLLLLGVIGAVFWMNRRQKGSSVTKNQPDKRVDSFPQKCFVQGDK